MELSEDILKDINLEIQELLYKKAKTEEVIVYLKTKVYSF